MHDHVPERLEESWLNARRKKVEYAYPFFDVKLVEFYYSLPAELKYKNGFGRYIFRKSMEGILPEEICWRKDKTGTTMPNLPYRLTKDAKEFRRIIEEGRENNAFHFIDYKKLDHNLDLLLNRHSGKKAGFGNRSFFSAIAVLILQQWQREGRIDIGIKC
ncbi:MAG TPA: hypothetical protein ENN61_04180 [Bacteroidaceae bacterium]|nr:hypothetical protein [Bacteroidaceae bacterium]